MLKAQLEDVEKKLDNLVEAMTQGIFSATTKKLLDDLEAQKKNIEAAFTQNEIRNPVLSKEQILFALCNYRKLDLSVQSDKQKLIDSFVNSIYLYDDHFIITFNYKNSSKKVSFKELNSSSLTSSAPPKTRNTHKWGVPCFLCDGVPSQTQRRKLRRKLHQSAPGTLQNAAAERDQRHRGPTPAISTITGHQF